VVRVVVVVVSLKRMMCVDYFCNYFAFVRMELKERWRYGVEREKKR
jgi:hypothetical protein